MGTQESSPGLTTPHLQNKRLCYSWAPGGFGKAEGRKGSEEPVIQEKLGMVSDEICEGAIYIKDCFPKCYEHLN